MSFLRDSQLIARFSPTLATEQVLTYVHDKFQPSFSVDVQKALADLNVRKRSKGLLGYYPGKCFRIITSPMVNESQIVFQLAPLNYAFVALIKDDDADTKTKVAMLRKISELADYFSIELTREHADFNTHTYSLLGTEVSLFTCDGLTLLRRRGPSVLTGRRRWDASVSGHPTEEDLYENRIDLAQTVYRETVNEIGHINADLKQIRFTGLHRNKASGDIDLCVLWPISNTADEVRALIAQKQRDKVVNPFKTTKLAPEGYVWDTDNLLLKMSGPTIVTVLKQLALSTDDILPEAFVCIELALLAQSQPPIGIGLA